MGISAALVMGVLLHAVVLRPLPYTDADRLLEVWDSWDGVPRAPLTAPEFFALRESAAQPGSTLASVCAWVNDSLVLDVAGEPKKLSVLAASHDLFRVLDVEPALGRAFSEAEDQPGADPVVLLSHRLWRQRHGADPDILGRRLLLEGVPRTVIGVLPRGFRMPRTLVEGPQADLWVPAQLQPEFRVHYFNVLARLEEERPLTALQSELDRVGQLSGASPTRPGYRVYAVPLHLEIVGEAATAAPVLAIATTVLVLASTVISALLWATYEQHRAADTRTRWALGATVARISLRSAREILWVAVTALATGALTAAGLLRWLRHVGADLIPRLEQAHLTATSIAAAGGIAAAAGLILYLAGFSAIRRCARVPVGASPSFRVLGGGSNLGTAVVAALATTLLVFAGLVGRSLARLEQVELGLPSRGLITGTLELPRRLSSDAAAAGELIRSLERRMGQLPDVVHFGVTSSVPLASQAQGPGRDIAIEGEARPIEQGAARLVTLSPGAIRALGLEVLEGRPFLATDTRQTTDVALINEAMARTFFAERRPLGIRIDLTRQQRARPGSRTFVPVPAWTDIVGVVADQRVSIREPPQPTIYVPHGQRGRGATSFVARHTGNEAAAVRSLRSSFREMVPGLPLGSFTSLEELRSRSLALPRFLATLGALFALLGVLLGALALRAKVRHDLAARRRDMAIRHALGARPTQWLSPVLYSTLLSATAGSLLGLATGALASVLAEASLEGVQAADAAILAFAATAGSVAWASATIPIVVASIRRFTAAELLRTG